MSQPQATSDNPAIERNTPQPTWLVSLCFWCALLLAALVYGTVAIAPKLAVWDDVRREYHQNVRQLVTLEEDVEYLERVESALRTDPDFLRRLVGVSRADDDSELIPVSGSLLFGQSDEETITHQFEDGVDSLLIAVTRRIASDLQLRNVMLGFSMLLTVFAFAFLNDAGSGFVNAAGSWMRRIAILPVARYFRPLEKNGETETEASVASAASTSRSSAE